MQIMDKNEKMNALENIMTESQGERTDACL